MMKLQTFLVSVNRRKNKVYRFFRATLRSPNDYNYETRHTDFFPAQSDFKLNTKTQKQKTPHFLKIGINVDQKADKGPNTTTIHLGPQTAK